MENQFGKYTLLKKLGDGGMAEVFLAEMKGPEGFSKLVAIKRILPHLSHDSVFTESFINEARLGGYLNHHNIVQTLDFGQIGGFYYLAMEYVHGINLRQLLQRCQDANARMPLPLALDIAYQICEGLVYAHLATDAERRPLKMIHRDLKPSNIMINSQGVVKIADFGVARAESNVAHTQMAQGNPKGTVAYMSPEQALGLLNMDQRADVFSLGAICFELLTNERLYTASTYLGALRQAQDAELGDRLTLLNNLSRGERLLPILQQALAAEREQRYPDSKAFAKDLRRAVLKVGSTGNLADFIERVLPDAFDRGALQPVEPPPGKPGGVSLMQHRPSAREGATTTAPSLSGQSLSSGGRPHSGGGVTPSRSGPPPSGNRRNPTGSGAPQGQRSPGSSQPGPSQPGPSQPGPSQPGPSHSGAPRSPGPAIGQVAFSSEAWPTPSAPGEHRLDPSAEAATIMRPAHGMDEDEVTPARPIDPRASQTLRPSPLPPREERHPTGSTPRPPGLEAPAPTAGSGGRLRQMMAALLSTVLLLSVGAFIALTMMSRRAQVTIVTEPPAATIRLPGGQEVDAPQSFKIPEGGLTISVTAPGYAAKEIQIPEDAPSGAEWRVRLSPIPSLLTVRVVPGEARLMVGGATSAGGSPYVLRDLPTGEPVSIEASAPGHEPYTGSITLEPGADQTLEISLKALATPVPKAPEPAPHSTAPAPQETRQAVEMGYLACNAVPKGGGSMWARVFIDGKYLGNTPMLKKAVPAGNHSIRLITEDGREKAQDVSVRAGKLSRVLMEFD